MSDTCIGCRGAITRARTIVESKTSELRGVEIVDERNVRSGDYGCVKLSFGSYRRCTIELRAMNVRSVGYIEQVCLPGGLSAGIAQCSKNSDSRNILVV